jgi:hypothetical protein
MEDDRTYYARRAAEQEHLAGHARDTDSRQRHRELAALMRVRAIGGTPPPPPPAP